jgi:biopolymer transport protein ExbD
MGKVKMARKSISLDMTAMCDMAFLLLNFFILTGQFKPEEAVEVTTPSSVAEVKLPDKDVLSIIIDKEGKVFFGVDAQPTRLGMLEGILGKYPSIQLTEKQKKTFSLMPSFGVPMSQLSNLLSAKSSDMKKLHTGIPVDSANNQLRDWIDYARASNQGLRIAVRGDSKANFKVVKRVIATLQERNINRFNVITNLEERPRTLPRPA